MRKKKRSIRKNKDGRYDVYFNDSCCPMYCGTFKDREEAKEFIKQQDIKQD